MNNKMKNAILTLSIATTLAIPMLAHAEAGNWVFRMRAVNVNPDEDSDLGKTVNQNVQAGAISPGAELTVDDNWIPEFDVSYYFTKNIAAELILAVGTRHDVAIKVEFWPHQLRRNNHVDQHANNTPYNCHN